MQEKKTKKELQKKSFLYLLPSRRYLCDSRLAQPVVSKSSLPVSSSNCTDAAVLTRLTNTFSKKLENSQAAVALNFGYNNS